MDRTRLFALGAGTLAVALGTGLVVQHMVPHDHPALKHMAWLEMTEEDICTDEPDGVLGASVVEVAADLDAANAMGGMMAGLGWSGAPFTVETDSQAAASMSLPEPRRPATEPTAASESTEGRRRDCTPKLQVDAASGAMVRLALDAPCLPDTRIVVRHAGLAVTARTSALGTLEMELPAFAEQAVVTVALPGPATVSARVDVPELRDYDRVAVQWQGSDAFQLHAYEFGAAHGTPGHVSAAAPGGPERALGGIGGFLTVLGDSRTDWPLLAEVYSFPAGRLSGAGNVELVLEAAITAETCGRAMLGESLELRRGGRPVASDIDVIMPSCDAIGGYVMLKRLLGDVTLARN